jgi:hypothetical protein
VLLPCGKLEADTIFLPPFPYRTVTRYSCDETAEFESTVHRQPGDGSIDQTVLIWNFACACVGGEYIPKPHIRTHRKRMKYDPNSSNRIEEIEGNEELYSSTLCDVVVGSEGVALSARLFGRARACLTQMIGPGAYAVERANAVPPLRGNPLARRASFALKTALELAHLRDALGVVWFGRAKVVVEPAIHDTRALVHDRLAVGVYLKESTRSQLQDTHLPSRSEHAVISGNQATLMFAVHACGHQRPFRYGTRSDVASCEAATAWFRFRHGMVLVSSRKGSGVRKGSGFVTEWFWFRHGRVLVSSRKGSGFVTEGFWFRHGRRSRNGSGFVARGSPRRLHARCCGTRARHSGAPPRYNWTA